MSEKIFNPSGVDAASVRAMADRIAQNARKTNGGEFTKYGALAADGTIIICDVISRTGEFIKVRFPDGREKMITAADGFIPVQAD